MNGHIEIAQGAQFGAKSGVTHSIKEAGNYSGFPAIPTKEWQRNTVRSRNLDKMSQQIKQLESELKELKSNWKVKLMLDVKEILNIYLIVILFIS